MTDATGSEAAQLLSISVAGRIAPFWRGLPKHWFAQFEAVVSPQKLSKESKYDLVISKLNRDDLTLVSDLLDDNSRDYEALKKRLLCCLQATSEEQFDKLLTDTSLGEQRPSQLYRRMAELAKSAGVEPDTVKKLWLRKLPASVRNALVAHENIGTEELTKLADRVLQTAKQCAIGELSENKKEQPNLEQELKNMTQK